VFATECEAANIDALAYYTTLYLEHSSLGMIGMDDGPISGYGVVITMGSGSFGAFDSTITGQVVANGDAYVDFTYCALRAVFYTVLDCNTSYGVSFRDCTIYCDENPVVSGAGVFVYCSVDYAWGSTGRGFAATLNGGGGGFPLPAESAANWLYDNTVAGLLEATDVQGALDELAGGVETGRAERNVNLKSVAQTTLYTVPADKLFIPKRFMVVNTNIGGAAAMPTVRFGTNGSPELFVPAEGLDGSMVANYKVQAWEVIGDAQPAGTVIEFGVTVAGASAAHIGTVVLEGTLIDV